MDPDNLPTADAASMDFGQGSSKPKAWKEIWGSGQGIGAVKSVVSAAELVERLDREYRAAGAKLAAEFLEG
jgi:nitronate monooxygenase